MLSTTSMPTNTCYLDDLDIKSEWTRGLRVVDEFLREVSEDRYKTVLPWTNGRAGWRVGELEVCVIWIYGSPVIELRNDARRDKQAVMHVPLVETLVPEPEELSTRQRLLQPLGNRWRNFAIGYARRL